MFDEELELTTVVLHERYYNIYRTLSNGAEVLVFTIPSYNTMYYNIFFYSYLKISI